MPKIVYDPDKLPATKPGYRGYDKFWNVYIREGDAPAKVRVVSPAGERIGTAHLSKRHDQEYGERAKGMFEYRIELFKT